MTAVIPGKSVGPFRLGVCVFDVLEWCQKHAMNLKQNQLMFNQTDALSSDLILMVNALGMRLRFESTTQRLKLIDCYDLSKTPLAYGQTTFSGTATPTFRGIYKTFGATYPGAFHPTKPLYLLQYPGICFFFHVSAEARQRVKASADLATELADAVANRIVIHSGATLTSVGQATVPPPIRDGDLYFEPVHLYVKKGIYMSKRRKMITFDCYTQDVLSELGSPAQVFIKQMDQMKIHTKGSPPLSSIRLDGGASGGSSSGGGGSGGMDGRTASDDEADNASSASFSDYLFNYFALGLDIVFDGATHRVKKFILHTNAIGSADFNQYRKCNFQLFIDTSMHRLQSVTSGGALPKSKSIATSFVGSGGGGGSAGAATAVTNSSVSAFLSTITGSTTHFASLSPTYAAAAPQFGWDDSKSAPPPPLAAAANVAADEPAANNNSGGSKKKNKHKPNKSPPADSKSITPAPAPAAVAPPRIAAVAVDVKSAPAAPAATAPVAPNAPHSTNAIAAVAAASAAASATPSVGGSMFSSSVATSIHSDTKWDVVQSVLASTYGLHTGRPMVHNSSKKENPFGSTYFYAYDGVLFDVLRDGYLKTVTLFSEF